MKNVKRSKLAYLLLLVSLGVFAHTDYPGKNSDDKKHAVITKYTKQVKPTKVVVAEQGKEVKATTEKKSAIDTNTAVPTATPVVVATPVPAVVTPVVEEVKRVRASEQELTRNLVSWVSIVSPIEKAVVTTHTMNGGASISDSYDLQGMHPFDKLNRDICIKIKQDLATINLKTGVQVASVRITGYSAPSGTPQKSEKVSMDRVFALREYLRESKVLDKVTLDVNWVAEDWSTLIELIQRSDMAFKDAVLGVISSTDATSGREKVLSQLADGVPYRYMKDRLYPLLEHMEYTITYTSKPAESTLRVDALTPGGVGLASLYLTAQEYAKDSQEYNDLMDIGARLFPESPQANINAAAVALIRKNTSRARRYLDKFSMHPAALCNMGILCFLEGNREKAELYLEMAVAKGSTQAQEALSYLKK